MLELNLLHVDRHVGFGADAFQDEFPEDWPADGWLMLSLEASLWTLREWHGQMETWSGVARVNLLQHGAKGMDLLPWHV